MKLLQSLLETVTEKLLDVCTPVAELFVKGCEPDSLDKLWGWFTENAETQPSDFSPIVPFGGF